MCTDSGMQAAHLRGALPVDLEQHVVARRDLRGEPGGRRRVPVAVDERVLEELAVVLERDERASSTKW